MRNARLAAVVTMTAVVAALALPSPASAAFLSTLRAKKAIGVKAYLTNGAYAVAYGARDCRRLSASRVNCQAYVEKERNGRRTVCTDRMTAVKRGSRVRVRGAAPPHDWRCHRK